MPAASVTLHDLPRLAAHNDTSTPFNLVSIPALTAHRYDGHDLRLGKVLDRDPAYTRYEISYRSGDLRIGGIMNVPHRTGRLPVVVIAHGWADARTFSSGDGQTREQAYLASRGYVVLQPDYRNYGASSRENASVVTKPLGYPDDLINAIRALREAKLAFVDGTRIGLLGRSMGGGVALNALVARPGLVAAAVLYSPVSSLATDNFDRWVRDDPAHADLKRRVLRSYGSPQADPAFWREASSRTYFDRISVPVQIHHGTADAVCPVRWSEQTAQALRRAGVSVSLYEYAGEPHRFGRSWLTMISRTAAFFDRYVR